MQSKTGYLIFLIPAIGILAGLALLRPETLPGFQTSGGALIAGGLVVAGAVSIPLFFRRKRRPARAYHAPRISSARVIEDKGVGEFIVYATSSKDVSDRLFIPPGSTISAIDKGREYRVLFPIPLKRTPRVFPVSLQDRDAVAHYSQTEADRAFVKEQARKNGYQGKVR